MKENRNYQLKLDKMLQQIEHCTKAGDGVPSLLLHSCCAPCSSYVLEYLSDYLSITVFYYNPNISEEAEYRKRIEEQKRLIRELPVRYAISFLEGTYNPEEYDEAVKGLEKMGERSERCYACYRLRMERTAKLGKENGFDYFTTTLSISPYKNAAWLNEIGERLENQYGIGYLYADFKKRNGYKRSIELSEQYHLYRQNFCGCKYSKAEEEKRKREIIHSAL
ncbi:MAG: epoxyqueuosine reductase QueH [Bacteroidales bacterium]|nr:epoxyqueuosine reductase QueH [Clostridium sp.]MCM1203872.1 epoxyqueuosine reductase QueH [Bacteroidales bacterium]